MPKTVTPSSAASVHSTSGPGCSGEPSYSTIVAPEASALASQFHIIQPQVVKKNRRSPGFRSVCSWCSFRCWSSVPPAPWTMHFGTPVVPLE